MSSHQGRSPMDRTTAERLLRGDRAALGPAHPLTELLDQAKAPAWSDELAGEAAALAAFRAAAQAPGPGSPRRRSLLPRLLTVAAFAATAAVGGVALAASTGALPGPATGPAKPSHSASRPPRPSPSAPPTPTPTAGPQAGPTVTDLCREWAGKDRDHRRRALDDERFSELVRRAGRRDRVDRFCALPGSSTRPSTRPSAWPSSRSSWPSSRPSTWPSSTRPTFGLPSGLPKTPQQHG
jgi:hypothetical protein